MDALIFDFDGVMVDSEPLHLLYFQQVLATVGIDLSSRDYYDRYVGFDDRDSFTRIMRDHGQSPTGAQLRELIARKSALILKAFAESIKPMPGALDLVRAAEVAAIPTAICSGGLRKEIELAAGAIGALPYFMAIVSAEDVEHGKPDPEGYCLALARLTQLSGRILMAPKTLVIEDAPGGIAAAKAAGMKVLAVTTSHHAEALTAADRVVNSLADVTIGVLEELVR